LQYLATELFKSDIELNFCQQWTKANDYVKRKSKRIAKEELYKSLTFYYVFQENNNNCTKSHIILFEYTPTLVSAKWALLSILSICYFPVNWRAFSSQLEIADSWHQWSRELKSSLCNDFGQSFAWNQPTSKKFFNITPKRLIILDNFAKNPVKLVQGYSNNLCLMARLWK